MVGCAGSGDECVRFGEIGCCGATWDVVWDGKESVDLASAIVPVACDPEFLNGFDLAFEHVIWIKENDHALISDATVAIVESVDRGVVLIVTAQGLEGQVLGVLFLENRERAGAEISFVVGSVPLADFSGIRQVETTCDTDSLIKILKARNGACDEVTNVIVVSTQRTPIDTRTTAEGGFCEARDDSNF